MACKDKDKDKLANCMCLNSEGSINLINEVVAGLQIKEMSTKAKKFQAPSSADHRFQLSNVIRCIDTLNLFGSTSSMDNL